MPCPVTSPRVKFRALFSLGGPCKARGPKSGSLISQIMGQERHCHSGSSIQAPTLSVKRRNHSCERGLCSCWPCRGCPSSAMGEGMPQGCRGEPGHPAVPGTHPQEWDAAQEELCKLLQEARDRQIPLKRSIMQFFKQRFPRACVT